MKKTHLVLASSALALFAGAAAAQQEIHIINCGAGADEQNPVQEAHADAWLEDNPDYTVRFEYVPWGSCQERAITLASAGDPAAAAYMGSRVLPQLADSGLILPIDLTEEETNTYEASVLSTVQVNGEIWGLPRAFSTKALFWNKDLFEEAGLDMPDGPTTWEEMVTAAQAISENTDAAGFGVPAADFDNTMHEWLNFVYSNGGTILQDDGTVTFDSPEVVEALQLYADLAPYVEEGPLAYDRGSLEPLFAEGAIAMYTNGGWGRQSVGEDTNYGIAPIPAGPSGDSGTLLITDSLVVFDGTGVEEATMDLITYLTSPERQSEFDLAGGWTPIRQTEDTAALIEEDASWAPFIEAIPNGGPEPQLIDYVSMQDVINEAIQAVLLEEATAEEAAADAQEELVDLAEE
ncbi:extracellular solute-binding protein [Pelagovum pacificum]|uniref:Extracellular solute-binding protein n=1 Tax=Pelagovum pacificum TaxID=2588711 RepID=A0A5C5GHT4_9RHOB|nr:extracellular solute-binding protein [Pelagovum pacificum]QQA43182.1 extracellular solute-binding protein [Pelagovum pacificum]TNY33677.1 extracellular solute-binding protein [Pelagovum pacificum]